MTKSKKWLPYVRQIADQLGLKDWEIEIKEESPKEWGAGASIESVGGRKLVYLRLADEFNTYEPEQQRYQIVHECIHIHWEPLYHWFFDRMNRDEKDIYRSHDEYATDGIATAVAKLLPLPKSKKQS